MSPILFVAGLYAEARPFIDHLKLSKLHGHSSAYDRLQVFGSDDALLVVSGTGKVAAAAVTGALIGSVKEIRRMVVMNAGICGAAPGVGAIGECFAVSKITDAATNHRWYLDPIVKQPFQEQPLLTADHPVCGAELGKQLVDMEGAGFAQAALAFLGPAQVACFKVISDHGSERVLSQAEVTGLIAPHAEAIIVHARALSRLVSDSQALSADEETVLAELSRRMQLTVSQRAKLRKELTMAVCAKRFDPRAISPFLALRISAKHDRNERFKELLSAMNHAG